MVHPWCVFARRCRTLSDAAGPTTLAREPGGLELGRHTRPDRLPLFRKRSVGFVFQQFHLFPALTALENVEYALHIKGYHGLAARREAERLLQAVELADRRQTRPRHLSGGQKQRVAIARALAGNAAIILADEPTASIDSRLGSQILDLFHRLAREENRAILIVSHDPKVRAVADRNIRIRDGVLLEDQEP